MRSLTLAWVYPIAASHPPFQVSAKRIAPTALFYQGEFRGLNTGGRDDLIAEVIDEGSLPPVRIVWDQRLSWSIQTQPSPFDTSPGSRFFGYYELYYTAYGDGRTQLADRQFFDSTFSYTLVDTEPEPVPEPLTAGGTALVLAGLSWLKHKKKWQFDVRSHLNN